VVNNDGQDRGQALGFGVIEHEGVPDAHQVAQEAEGHERIARALVLQQDVQECGAAFALDFEEEVGMSGAEAFVDEACGLELEGRPIQALAQRWRQDGGL
jgi:hypothetical protein